MNGLLSDASVVMGCSAETLFQQAARFAGYTNYLEVGTFRYLQTLHHEATLPTYVSDYCLDCLSFDETAAKEGGIVHLAAD